MKPQREFLAERPLAEHCAELLRQGPGPDELLPLIKRMGERYARRLSGALAPLLGGEAPMVSCTTPRETTLDSLHQSIASLAANSLMAVGDAKTPMLVSIEAEPMLRIVDRAFGGKGEAPAPLPKSFPMAAELMLSRMETMLADNLSAAVTATAGGARGGQTPELSAIRRDGNLAMLAPFAESTPLAMWTMEVDDGGVLPWLITFAMPFASLARLFGYSDAGVVTMAQSAPRAPADPSSAPFGDVPVSVSAILVDMRISFPTIATLAPGVVLPVAVARQVPLRVGDSTIAYGTVGTMDDRVAVQINQAFADNRSAQ
jgi:flagellar motor switch protein FliM